MIISNIIIIISSSSSIIISNFMLLFLLLYCPADLSFATSLSEQVVSRGIL